MYLIASLVSELIFPINYGIKFIQTQREMSFTVLKWLHGSGVAVPQLTSLAGVSFLLFKV